MTGTVVRSSVMVSLGCKGVFTKLNDVAFRVESITHRDAVERPFSIGWLHDSAMRLGNHSETRDAGTKKTGLNAAIARRAGEAVISSGTIPHW